ncbi:mutator type transposase, partial [Tanacetum coccineum]
MEEIKKFNKEMYEWLKDIPPHHWARSYFYSIFTHLNLSLPHLLLNVSPYCDVLLNNMREVLNRQLLNGRDKPIITCLEFIREYLMKRIVIVQGVIRKSIGPPTPSATKVFNVIKREAAQYKEIGNHWHALQACNGCHLEYGKQWGRLSRAGKTVTCLKCGQQGHNKRSCKGQRQKGSASGSQAPPQAPSQTTTQASAQAPQSSTQPTQATAQAPQSSTQASQSYKFTKSTANRLSPSKTKFVSPRPAATQRKSDVSSLLFETHHMDVLVIRTYDIIRNTDTLHQGQQLKDWDYLVSSKQNLQFKVLWLWHYHKPLSRSILQWKIQRWLLPLSGQLRQQPQQNQILLYGRLLEATVLDLFSPTLVKRNASVTLLDSGNLVLQELFPDGYQKKVLWQSFDYPTDTLLPGMKLGIN